MDAPKRGVEGLCSVCGEWVIPEKVRDGEGHLEEVFCPICGDEFIDIHDRDIDKEER